MYSDASTDHVREEVSRPDDLIELEGFEGICHLVEIEPNKLDIHCLKQLGSWLFENANLVCVIRNLFANIVIFDFTQIPVIVLLIIEYTCNRRFNGL